ncbi:MAG: hypothetical protein C0518_05485 [Opitutus sp.]|nr:hypothetical protein [Opitutus sp.]
MKALLASAFLLLATHAAPSSAPDPNKRLDLGPTPFAWTAKHPRTWPSHVTLRMPVSVKLYEGKVEIGSAVLVQGLRMELRGVQATGILEVRRGSIRCLVDHAATDFLENLR